MDPSSGVAARRFGSVGRLDSTQEPAPALAHLILLANPQMRHRVDLPEELDSSAQLKQSVQGLVKSSPARNVRAGAHVASTTASSAESAFNLVETLLSTGRPAIRCCEDVNRKRGLVDEQV